MGIKTTKTIVFVFDLDETVTTMFGEEGIIDCLGFDDGGKKYYVRTKLSGSWFKESQIKKKGNSI